MKALSVRQPWASMIASGRKTIEVRSWSTRYRGPLLICATQRPQLPGLPAGVALCVVELVDCRPMTQDDEQAAGIPVQPGHFAWLLQDIQRIATFRVVGRLGLFDADAWRDRTPATGHAAGHGAWLRSVVTPGLHL